MPDHAQVSKSVFFYCVEKAADAGAVHLDRDEVDLRMRPGDLDGRLAHARADLEHQGFFRPDFFLGEGETVLRVELLECARLRRGSAALAQDEAANGAVQAAFEEIVPSVGEEGAAL